MNPSTIEILGTAFFACAVIHTFLVSKFEHVAHHFKKGSAMAEVFHFLGEVEVVFGMWAGILIISLCFLEGPQHTIQRLESLDYTEPAFVFVIMTMSGTKPVIWLASRVIEMLSKFVPLPGRMSFYVTTLIFGPILGSFITEPAAMTVTAMILLKAFYSKDMSKSFKYGTLGLLFVNVSIGGTLTNFAAPPVLMVARKWNWDMSFMMGHFGYKAAIAIVISTLIVAYIFRKELKGRSTLPKEKEDTDHRKPTWWVLLFHIVFLGLVVLTSHHMVIFFGLFLFFLGFCAVSQEYQDKLKLKEALLVGFFLGGLVTLGSLQAWWLSPILTSLGDIPLYIGTAGLTAITDNAALTYLGSFVDLSESAKYALVAGAVAGGGLTVIANAPNPAGFGILKKSFGEDGINPLGLLVGSLGPTILSLIIMWVLPHINF